MSHTLYLGNPEFPNEEPKKIQDGGSTNDTDIFYILDPGDKSVAIGDMQKEDGTTSVWANTTIGFRLYGRFKKIVVPGSDPLACYRLIPANSEL